jgi:hypothetical protein
VLATFDDTITLVENTEIIVWIQPCWIIPNLPGTVRMNVTANVGKVTVKASSLEATIQ